MSWASGVYTKFKDFANGGTLLPDDLDSIQEELGEEIASIMVNGGFSDSSAVRRGKCIVPTEQSRTNSAYGLMSTPDRVQGIVLPADGLIFVAYRAMWKESVADLGRAAIFVGANQLMDSFQPSPLAQEAQTNYSGAGNIYAVLSSRVNGLHGDSSGTAYTGDVMTGQSLSSAAAGNSGGPVCIFAAAGTYDISVMFKSASGSVTVKERKLWCWTQAF